MEIKITTKHILQLLNILSWIIFIGVCVEAGFIICNAVLTMVLDPADAKNLWREADLSSLYAYDHGYFLVQKLLMSIVAVMKAIIFYLIVKILQEKKLDMSQPFNAAVGRFIFNISYLAVATGVFSLWGSRYAMWFVKQGIKMPDIEQLHLGGADVWLFMGVILFVIANIFKRGIEIQAENDLTI